MQERNPCSLFSCPLCMLDSIYLLIKYIRVRPFAFWPFLLCWILWVFCFAPFARFTWSSGLVAAAADGSAISVISDFRQFTKKMGWILRHTNTGWSRTNKHTKLEKGHEIYFQSTVAKLLFIRACCVPIISFNDHPVYVLQSNLACCYLLLLLLLPAQDKRNSPSQFVCQSVPDWC